MIKSFFIFAQETNKISNTSSSSFKGGHKGTIPYRVHSTSILSELKVLLRFIFNIKNLIKKECNIALELREVQALAGKVSNDS